MRFTVLTRNLLLVVLATLLLSACATKVKKIDSQIQGDVYTGTETVEYLAKGVPDRVFFATNESVLTTRSRDTLRKQAAWMRKNSSLNFLYQQIPIKYLLKWGYLAGYLSKLYLEYTEPVSNWM